MPKARRSRCVFRGCGKRDTEFPDLKFFFFPKDSIRREEWIRKCGDTELIDLPYEKCRYKSVCESHFSVNSFVNFDQKKLKKTAVPSDTFDYESAISQVRRKNPKETNHTTASLKRKIEVQTRKIKTLQNKLRSITPEQIIDNCEANTNAKLLCKMQLLRKKGGSWSTAEKQFALDFYYRAPNAYKYLRNEKLINFPGESSIRRWSNVLNLQPGFSKILISALKQKCSTMEGDDRKCVLLFDEIVIRKSLDYNPKFDCLEGYEDLCILGRKPQFASEALVFMIRGLHRNYKIPFAYFLSSGPIKASSLYRLILQCVEEVQNSGFNLKVLVCDQGTNNQGAVKMLGATADNPRITIRNTEVVVIYDIVHLFKSVRNRLHDNDFIVGNNRISWQDIRAAYNIDCRGNLARSMCHLSPSHIDPNNFQKMNVRLATQIFSHRTSAGIRTAVTTGELSSQTGNNTADFLFKMNNIFDIMNSKKMVAKNPYLRALSQQNELAIKALQEAKDWIATWKVIVQGNNLRKREIPPCFVGIRQTINGTLMLFDNESKETTNVNIRTYRLNQDPLENCFSELRRRGGFNKYPSAYELRNNLEDIILNSVLTSNTTGNCLADETPMLLTIRDIQRLSAECSKLTESHELSLTEDNAMEENEQNEIIIDPNELSLEKCDVTYFAGYILHKCYKKFRCDVCLKSLSKDPIYYSNVQQQLILNRAYKCKNENELGNLCVPSDMFTNIVNIQLQSYNNIFENIKHTTGILKQCVDAGKKITDELYDDWFDVCTDHKMFMLSHLYKVKLFKYGKWETDCQKASKHKDKLQKLSH